MNTDMFCCCDNTKTRMINEVPTIPIFATVQKVKLGRYRRIFRYLHNWQDLTFQRISISEEPPFL